jgi:hypothetical protein
MSVADHENTVLWRLRSPTGERARLTFIPGHPANTLAWFLGDTLDRVENHATWDEAILRADETKAELLADGWRDDS